MKEVIIKYKDSRVLELLKSLTKYLDFSISEKQKEGIVPESGSQKKTKAADFVNKWAGFLKKDDTDDSKYDYLAEKYK